jgi:S-adenosylmethionine hydrolase
VRYDWVSFTTDYGTTDGFVAACKGVIARTAPHVRVLDVTHEVGPQDIRRGCTVLAQTIGYLPPSVHVAVVDPGVGTARRGVVLVTGAGLLVGPDNGLLLAAADVLGGVEQAHELLEPRFRLDVVAATFHGRDVFAPAAAHLALGVAPADFGPPVDPADLVRLPAPATTVDRAGLTSEVVGTDHFGNLQLAAGPDDLAAFGAAPGEALLVRLGARTVDARWGTTFGDVATGAVLVHLDSAGRLAVAVHGGSAATVLDGRTGDVTISRPPATA